ncbi:MAG: FtsW/RodA/SpoVE family cell cycle protein, partial [Bacillota bacterium]|nr:FtsW/RodA/SpoVE family cell cycle protein [Bacillota bacterium]
MRKLERHLLRLASVLIVLGLSSDLLLGSAGERRWWGPALGAMLALLWAFTAWVLRRRRFQGDELLLPLVALLSGVGIVFLFHFQPALAWRQAIWLALGLAFFLLLTLALPTPARLEPYCYLSGAGAVLLLALTVLFGKSVGGARSWLEVGPLTFEPSELSKILLVIFLAGYLARAGENLVSRDLQLGGRLLPRPNWTYFGPALLVWGGSLLLLALQKDIGAAVLALAVFLLMVYAASGEKSLLLFGLFWSAAALAGAAAAFPHVRLRFLVWLHPWRSAAEGGYQVLQGLFALGTGGLWGTGLGQGHPDLIPAVATDLILAGIGEELGLAGSAAVLLALWLLLSRGLLIARRARDRFDQLLALGFTAVLAVQAFAITGGVVRLWPLTGVPFPFVSYGGSALISNLILVGLLAKVDAEKATSPPGQSIPLRTLAHLWTGSTAAVLLALLALVWWQLITGPSLAQDPRNPRTARQPNPKA